MRYINVFCGRYSLATGTRFIAWFYIILYLINIILNILATDIVKSYKENVDEDTDYDENKLLTFHYISLTFGIVTIFLSAAFLVKFWESENFLKFLLKWNVVRCVFCVGAIIYVIVDMHHILTVALSSLMLFIDTCASAYFTGVLASYIKQLDDPSDEIYSKGQSSNAEPTVYLVSHKRSLHGENKVSYVNEVSKTEPDGFLEVPLNDEAKTSANADHNSKVTGEQDDNTNQKSSEQHQQQWEKTREEKGSKESNKNTCQKGKTEPEKISSSESEKTGEDSEKTGVENPTAPSEKSSDNKGIENLVLSETSSDDKRIETPVPSEKSRDDQEIQNPVPSEKSSDDKWIENPVLSEKTSDDKVIENHEVDMSEIDLPSLVLTPASPDQESLGNLDSNKDKEGTDNPVFEADE